MLIELTELQLSNLRRIIRDYLPTTRETIDKWLAILKPVSRHAVPCEKCFAFSHEGCAEDMEELRKQLAMLSDRVTSLEFEVRHIEVIE